MQPVDESIVPSDLEKRPMRPHFEGLLLDSHFGRLSQFLSPEDVEQLAQSREQVAKAIRDIDSPNSDTASYANGFIKGGNSAILNHLVAAWGKGSLEKTENLNLLAECFKASLAVVDSEDMEQAQKRLAAAKLMSTEKMGKPSIQFPIRIINSDALGLIEPGGKFSLQLQQDIQKFSPPYRPLVRRLLNFAMYSFESLMRNFFDTLVIHLNDPELATVRPYMLAFLNGQSPFDIADLSKGLHEMIMTFARFIHSVYSSFNDRDTDSDELVQTKINTMEELIVPPLFGNAPNSSNHAIKAVLFFMRLIGLPDNPAHPSVTAIQKHFTNGRFVVPSGTRIYTDWRRRVDSGEIADDSTRNLYPFDIPVFLDDMRAGKPMTRDHDYFNSDLWKENEEIEPLTMEGFFEGKDEGAIMDLLPFEAPQERALNLAHRNKFTADGIEELLQDTPLKKLTFTILELYARAFFKQTFLFIRNARFDAQIEGISDLKISRSRVDAAFLEILDIIIPLAKGQLDLNEPNFNKLTSVVLPKDRRFFITGDTIAAVLFPELTESQIENVDVFAGVFADTLERNFDTFYRGGNASVPATYERLCAHTTDRLFFAIQQGLAASSKDAPYKPAEILSALHIPRIYPGDNVRETSPLPVPTPEYVPNPNIVPLYVARDEYTEDIELNLKTKNRISELLDPIVDDDEAYTAITALVAQFFKFAREETFAAFIKIQHSPPSFFRCDSHILQQLTNGELIYSHAQIDLFLVEVLEAIMKCYSQSMQRKRTRKRGARKKGSDAPVQFSLESLCGRVTSSGVFKTLGFQFLRRTFAFADLVSLEFDFFQFFERPVTVKSIEPLLNVVQQISLPESKARMRENCHNWTINLCNTVHFFCENALQSPRGTTPYPRLSDTPNIPRLLPPLNIRLARDHNGPGFAPAVFQNDLGPISPFPGEIADALLSDAVLDVIEIHPQLLPSFVLGGLPSEQAAAALWDSIGEDIKKAFFARLKENLKKNDHA